MWQINFSILYSHNTIDEIVRKGYVVCIRIGKWIAATVTQLNHGQIGVRKASKRDAPLYLHDLRREWNQSSTIRCWYLMFMVFVSSSFFDDVSTGSLACVFLF